MTAQERDYLPSAWDPVAEQVALFERTDGREGDLFEGGKIIVLTTVGRRTGALRKTPLMRVEHEGRYAVIGSLGGAPADPVWVHNVRADPHVWLQDGADRRQYQAHETTGEEKSLWWERALAAWPDYAVYQSRTERVIPLFVLTPHSQA
jgi:deazaflavin-dependent oxidoreductase (nitroreductase family)